MDYRKYRLNGKLVFRYGLESMGMISTAAFCCYDSWWLCMLWPIFFFWYLRKKRQELIYKRRAELRVQFGDMVQAVAAALAAGYSAENAVQEARKDLQQQYSLQQDMVQELMTIQRRLDANQTLECCFAEFACRSGLEEAESFAEVFAVGKRSGGDLIEIMKDTARMISESVETQRQVETVLASRRYEWKIMCFLPVVIVVYLRLGSPGFLDALYHNVVGLCVTTVCLTLYVLGIYLGEKLLQIEV